jgi:hypothetical protein
MKKMIAFALVAMLALPGMVFAQTMSVSVDDAGVLTQTFDVGFGQTFFLVVNLDTGGEGSTAAEFIMTELLNEAPGVFKLSTTKVNDALDLSDNTQGDYLLAFQTCVPGGAPVEIVRVEYGAFQGIPANDTVISLRGFQPGDRFPSTFGGEMGYIDCSDNGFPVFMGGTDGGITGADVVFPDGSCVLNPTPIVVDNEAGSVGQLKARF